MVEGDGSNLQLLRVEKTFVYLTGVEGGMFTCKPIYFVLVIIHHGADCIYTKQTILVCWCRDLH
jgi:hypothetical protein